MTNFQKQKQQKQSWKKGQKKQRKKIKIQKEQKKDPKDTNERWKETNNDKVVVYYKFILLSLGGAGVMTIVGNIILLLNIISKQQFVISFELISK